MSDLIHAFDLLFRTLWCTFWSPFLTFFSGMAAFADHMISIAQEDEDAK